MNIHTINLVVSNTLTIYLSNGSNAGTISPGNYVAELNLGQQPGCYSLYEADQNFVKGDLKQANIFLSVSPTGRVEILA